MKYLFFLLLFFSVNPVWADNFTIIKGKVHNPRLRKIELFKTVNGRPVSFATTEVAPDGTYGFLFSPETPGFFSVGSLRENFMFYVKGNDEVNLDVFADKAKLVGQNSEENTVLYKWRDYAAGIAYMALRYDDYSITYKEFFPAYEKFLEGVPSLLSSLESVNPVFDSLLRRLVAYETDFYGAVFLQTPRLKQPVRSEWPAVFSKIPAEGKFNDDVVLGFPKGISMVSTFVNFCAMCSGQKFDNQMAKIVYRLGFIDNPRVKDEFLFMEKFALLTKYDHYVRNMKNFGGLFTDAEVLARAEAVGTKLYKPEPGVIAADFTYPDMNGKMVSLSDFKGKVVLIDVWATWCKPCRAELPSLIRLEKEMRGTGLVVMGVSVNEKKDKQKWMDFVKKEGLGGIQLFAGGWSKITKDYRIPGIPRFMVIGKDGRIVSVKAPRPSHYSELKALLEAELKK